MRCKICQNEFILSKYRPNQQVCSRPECQRTRQIQNERDWRTNNPDYFKYRGEEISWCQTRRRYNRLWRATHKESLKEYEQRHKQQRRVYMREYMRRRRETTRFVNRDKS